MTTITRPEWHEQLIDALERRGLVCVGGSLGSTYHVLPDATDGPRCRISDHAGNDNAVMVGPTLGCDIRLPAWGGWDDVEAVADDVVRRLRAAMIDDEDASAAAEESLSTWGGGDLEAIIRRHYAEQEALLRRAVAVMRDARPIMPTIGGMDRAFEAVLADAERLGIT